MSYIVNFEKELPSFQPLWNVWNVDEKIGEGVRGNVYRLKRTEIDNTDYYSALKVICLPASETESQHIYAMKKDQHEAQKIVRDMVQETTREVMIMYKLKGLTNIVSYEDHLIIPTENSNRYYILIRMEFVTSFIKVLQEPERYPMKEKDVIQLGIDICSALETCQKYHIIHRDIKPDNLFVSSQGNFKLGDFGISRIFDHTMMASAKGTIAYMAPEVYCNKGYNNKADIYSLGIVMYQLLNDNRLPLLAPDYKYCDIEKAIFFRLEGAELPLPENAQNDLGQLLLRACAYKPEDRFKNPAEMRESLETLRDDMKRCVYMPFGIAKTRANRLILWVDDCPENNVYARNTLESYGITFDLALSTDRALNMLHSNNYSLIISDMERKEGPYEGYTLLSHIRNNGNNIPFIFFFPEGSRPEYKAEAERNGAQGSTDIASEVIFMVIKLLLNS